MKERLNELIKEVGQLNKEIDDIYRAYVKGLIHERSSVKEGINYVIMPLGLQYETSCITLALTKPTQVLFLYTEDSKTTLDTILDLLQLESQQYEAHLVDDADPLTIYSIINDTYYKWGKPQNVYMDITGGTKAMSVATAWSGITFQAQFLYLTTDHYIEEINRPALGEEELIILDNPITYYGDLDIDMAYEHMEAYDYVSASEIFHQLMNKTSDIKRRKYFKILYHLSSGYEHWDNLEFKEGYKDFHRLIELIETVIAKEGQCILGDKLPQLKHQKSLLNQLGYEFENSMNFDIVRDLDRVLALIMTIYRSAVRRREQEKYDMAVLLLYRLLEIISQRRLAVNHINYESPDFFNMLGEEGYVDFKLKFNKLKNMVFSDHRTYKPPRRHITLIDGYFILATFNDELMKDKNKVNFIKELYGYCKVRNQSVFAHGYKVISEEEFEKFQIFVDTILIDFYKLENIDLTSYQDRVKFIHPEKTKYV